MDGIAKTSLLTAAMRAVESSRSEKDGRLFFDPFAESLAGEEGMALMRKAVSEVGDQPAIAVRTAYMDEKVLSAFEAGAQQVVMLAAGMDTRAYRLDFPQGVHLFEIDQTNVLEYKKKVLKNQKPRCNRVEVPADLRFDWVKQLQEAGFEKSKKTLWMVEGLLMYLSANQVQDLFHKINSLARPGDRMLFDILGRSLLEAPHMQKQLQFLSEMGAPWQFGENDPEQMMKDLGWKAICTQPGEYLPSRWPFPVAPRNVPNVPRSYFVEAEKQE